MDIEHIKSLVELMVEKDLSRIELREGDTQILLRRGDPAGAVAPPAATPPPAVQVEPGPAAPPPTADLGEVHIRSPMVGTFHAAPDPESPPFIKVGDTVGPDSVVCLVEAMKVFNEIKAEAAGRITRVLAKNAEAVEFDQPLFAIAPA